jgi:Sperm-tail PG-rich repeat
MPGPGEYDMERKKNSSPAYTMRLKLDRELDPPPYPGPGAYDVEDSTIANWGAGMAAAYPKPIDDFLEERTAVFHRGILAAKEILYAA